MPPAASTSLSVSEQDLVNILMDRFADGVRRPAQPSSSAAFQNTTSPFDLPQPLSEAASSSSAAAAAAAAPAGSATCAAAASSSADAAPAAAPAAARRPPMWPGGGAASADAPEPRRAPHISMAQLLGETPCPRCKWRGHWSHECAVCGVDAPDRPPPPEEDEEVQYVLVDFSESRLPPETLRAFLTSREHAFDNMLTPHPTITVGDTSVIGTVDEDLGSTMVFDREALKRIADRRDAEVDDLGAGEGDGGAAALEDPLVAVTTKRIRIAPDPMLDEVSKQAQAQANRSKKKGAAPAEGDPGDL